MVKVSITVISSVGMAIIAAVIAVIAFVPTYQAGIDGVEETVASLRTSIVRRSVAETTEFFSAAGNFALSMAVAEETDSSAFRNTSTADALQRLCRVIQHLPAVYSVSLTAYDHPTRTTLSCSDFVTGVIGKAWLASVANQTHVNAWPVNRQTGTPITFIPPVVTLPYPAALLKFVNYKLFNTGAALYEPQWAGIGVGPASLAFDVIFATKDSHGNHAEVSLSMELYAIEQALGNLTLSPQSRAFIADATNRKLFATSWGERGYRIYNETHFWQEPIYTNRMEVFNVSQIRDELSQSAVKYLGGEEGFYNTATPFETSFEGPDGLTYLDLVSITDRFGLNLRLALMVPRKDYVEDIERSRVVTLVSVCAAIVVMLILVIVFAVLLTRPLRTLEHQMSLTAKLQDSDDQSKEVATSVLSEVYGMQLAYGEMKRNLTELKRFVPQSLFYASQGENSVTGDDQSMSATSYGTERSGRAVNPLGGSITTINADSNADSGVDGHLIAVQQGSTSPSQQGIPSSVTDMFAPISPDDAMQAKKGGLDSRRLFVKTNHLTLTECVVLVIKFNMPTPDASECSEELAMFHETVAGATSGERGVIEHLRPARAVISFGARYSVSNPAECARRTAFRVSKRLNKRSANASTQELKCCAVLDRGRFAVGAVGTDGQREQILDAPDMDWLLALPDLVNARLGMGVVATERIASSITHKCEKVPVDCVVRPSSNCEEMLFAMESRPSSTQNLSAVQNGCARIRSAFAALRSGATGTAETELNVAIVNLQHISASFTYTAERLLRIAKIANDSGSAAISMTRPAIAWAGLAGEPLLSGPDDGQGRANLATQHAEEAVEKLRKMEKQQLGAFEASTEEGGALFALAVMEEDDDTKKTLPTTGLDGVGAKSGVGEETTVLQIAGNKWRRSRRELGAGVFGAVHRLLNDNGSLAAVKTVPLLSNKTSIADLKTELQVASRIRHENLVAYVDTDVSETELRLLMELVPGGSLQSVMDDFGSLPLHVVRRFVVDMLHGLAHLHDNQIVHCDLKPQNVLLGVDGVCKVADFGSCVQPGTMEQSTSGIEEEFTVARGTPAYMAPEVAHGEQPVPASDIWSLGILVHELLTGAMPWNEAQRRVTNGLQFVALLSKIREDSPKDATTAPPVISVAAGEDSSRAEDATLFVQSCLAIDPAKRPSARSLLASPFVL